MVEGFVSNDVCWQPAHANNDYRITTINWACNAAGVRVSCRATSGTFTRGPALLDGRAADRFVWHGFDSWDGEDLTKPPDRRLPEANGFEYVIDFEAEIGPLPVDTSPIPRTQQGFTFYGCLLDSHVQFDYLRTKTFGLADGLAAPGTSVRRRRCEVDIEQWPSVRELVLDDSEAEAHTVWLGSGPHRGGQCEVLFYRAENVKIAYSAHARWASTRYAGHIYVAQGDAFLVGGDLYEFGGGDGEFFNREVRLTRIDDA